ncbi:MAG: hypothetical protein WCW53_11410 [Syntrophales bacterium]
MSPPYDLKVAFLAKQDYGHESLFARQERLCCVIGVGKTIDSRFRCECIGYPPEAHP